MDNATVAIQTSAHKLVARNLRLERGTRFILNDVSLSIASGHALILRGANGSGKTSMLRILAGLTLPDAGAVEWNGHALTALSPTWRRAALYLGHNNALKDEFSAAENLCDALDIDGIVSTPSERLAALESVGLLERRNVLTRRLSQGQKRRVGLARLSVALSHTPRKPIWLLDEPTNALDDNGAFLFTGLIRDHLERGGIACIATHLVLKLASPVSELHLDAPTEVAQ